MSTARVAAVVALLGLACLADAEAQGLGDTAARERKKRTEAKKEPAKVFTNEDLDAGRPPGSKPSAGSEAAGPAGEEPEPASASEPSRQELERPYLDAIREAESRVAAAEARVKELAAKLNPMSTTYIYGASGSNDASEELRTREELNQAEGELQASREALVAANQGLQDFRLGRSPAPLVER